MKRLVALMICAVSLLAAAQLPDYVPTDGLVAWYPFNGAANDESSFGNETTVFGASLTEDRFGMPSSAFSFDGDDHIESPHQQWLDHGDGSYTWAGWGLNSGTSGWGHLMTKGVFTSAPYSAKAMWLRIYNSIHVALGDGQAGSGFEADGNGLECDVDNQMNQWFHLVGVKNKNLGLISIYLNGSLVCSAELDSPDYNVNQSGGLFIGCEHPYVNLPSGPQYFVGKLDDLGIWDRALTLEEILGLYNAPAPSEGCTDSTACNFNFDAELDDGSCHFLCQYCKEGTVWDEDIQGCIVANPSDSNFDGCVQLNDLLDLLSAYGDCAAEESTWQCGDPLEYQGYDYETVLIGEQCWFAENLRAENYRNMDVISSALSDSLWSDIGSVGAFTWPSHDNATEELFGKLYNGWVVIDPRGICPFGWEVPTSFQLTLLMNNYSDFESAGEALKDDVWWNGSNSSGFTARPAGAQSYLNAGFIVGFGSGARMWGTSSAPSLPHLHFSPSHAQIDGTWDNNYGLSIRCIKDTE